MDKPKPQKAPPRDEKKPISDPAGESGARETPDGNERPRPVNDPDAVPRGGGEPERRPPEPDRI